MCVGVCMTEVSDSILPCSLDKSQCSRHLEVNLTQASRHPAEEHLHLHQSKVSNFIVPSQLLLIQNLTWCILEDIVENLFLWEFLYWEYSLWISIDNPLKSLNHCHRVWPTSNQGWLWISSLSAMENALEMWVKCRHFMFCSRRWWLARMTMAVTWPSGGRPTRFANHFLLKVMEYGFQSFEFTMF